MHTGVYVDKFDNFIRFVDLDKLEHITLSLRDRFNESPEVFEMLKKPVIINCKELYLRVFASRPLRRYYMGLKNRLLILHNEEFRAMELRMLIRSWKHSDRPIGTCFSLISLNNGGSYLRMLSHMTLPDTFPVPFQRDSTQVLAIGLKIDDNRDLVLYLGRQQVYHDGRMRTWDALKMEVVESGFGDRQGDFEPNIAN